MLRPWIWQLSKAISKKKVVKRFKRRLRTSGLFDEAWYVSAYPDVGTSGHDPIEHFCNHGDIELRNPNPTFDSRLYAETFRVDLSRMGPVEHLISTGPRFYKLVHFISARTDAFTSMEAERNNYRLRYYVLKAAFDRTVAEADAIRVLYAKEMEKSKVIDLSDV